MLLSNASVFAAQSYHYLIAGGGTAGLTLAARLSANPAITVGVIEAGEWRNDDPRVYIPGRFGQAIGSELDWDFKAVPQQALDGGVVSWARGKMLGGSSGLNFMIWQRAGKREYDNWEGLGNEGWNWENILKYSKKAQTVNAPTLPEQLEILPEPPYDPEYHGSDGPLQTSFTKWHAKATEAFLPALENIGVPTNPEPLSGNNVGGFVTVNTIDPANTTRSYSASAYLLPNIDRQNLVVLTGATATRVIIDGKRAKGVEFIVGGVKHSVQAIEEVILCAGSVQSPQLLELSGIGRKELLAEAGIECKVDNPNVGENLAEHHFTPVTYEFIPGVPTGDLYSDPSFLAAAQAAYASNRSGILSSNLAHYAMLPLSMLFSPEGASEITKFARSLLDDPSKCPRDRKIDQVLFDQLNATDIGQIEIIWAPGKFSPTAPGETGKTYLTLIPVGMIPYSRGSIHINPASPLSPPLINPMVYSHPVDKKLMLAGLRFIEKLAATTPLAEYLVKRIEPPPGELSDEEWWSHVKKTTQTTKHPAGTCAMLPQELGGVVDDRLRVYGVKGLRVVDASIFPVPIAAHLQATVYGVAEKAADIILSEH